LALLLAHDTLGDSAAGIDSGRKRETRKQKKKKKKKKRKKERRGREGWKDKEQRKHGPHISWYLATSASEFNMILYFRGSMSPVPQVHKGGQECYRVIVLYLY